jgi:ATP-dependent protease ClpP protease subunit
MARNKSWFNIEGKATDSPTIYIYGVIGAYDIGAKDFIKELVGIKAKEATIRMHSPGGNVFEGMSIFNAIEEHPATIKGQVDGMCGSICSVIAMACNTLTMAKGSMMMIHNASGPINGNAAEMRKLAGVLDQVDGIQVAAYKAKTGMTEEEIKKLMDDETYMNADKSKALGFCDCVGNQLAVRAEIDFSCLGNVPDEVKAMFNGKDLPTNERDLESILRDAGLTKKEALTAVAGLKAEALRDSEASEAQKFKEYLQIEACRLLFQ